MRILHYALGAIILTSSVDLHFIPGAGKLYACPRCRKALPKGPRKLPHPGFTNKHGKASTPASSVKNTAEKPCPQSCCCTHKKKE